MPTREELHERHARYPGLTRPELALAHRVHQDRSRPAPRSATVLVDDSYLVERFLQPYFPPSLAAFHADVGAHRLRHELIATRAVNELVDLVGSTFVFSHGARSRRRGRRRDPRMDHRGRRAFDSRARRRTQAQRCERSRPKSELGAFLALERACRSATGWALGEFEPATSIGAAVTRFKPAFESCRGEFETMLRAASAIASSASIASCATT